MKKIFSIVIFSLATASFAQVETVKHDGEFLEVTTPENMPLPLPDGELHKLQKANMTISNDGFSTIETSVERVSNFLAHFNAVKSADQQQQHQLAAEKKYSPEIHKNLSKLNLGFEPASFANGTMLYALPIGTKLKDSWTGVERFFDVPGAGIARLTEYDLGLTGGKFFMAADSINTQVGGKQAISKIFADEKGQFIEEVVWVAGSKFYTLTFAPNLIEGKAGARQKAIAHIGAVSLAGSIQ